MDQQNSHRDQTYEKYRKYALVLAIFTVVYNVIESGISIFFGSISGSSALFGFGLDAIVESFSGCIMVWRFWNVDLPEEVLEQKEDRAERLVGMTFLLLGSYVLYDAVKQLVMQNPPDASIVGMVIAAISILIMPLLYWLKLRVGNTLESRSLVADAKETLFCSILSVTLLAGLGANYLFGLWYADPAAALVISVFLFREGFELVFEDEGN